jgi:hypothetical protein
MSSRNDEASAYGVVLAVLVFAAMFMFALVVFISLLLSIAALFDWLKPDTMKPLIFEPKEAREFIEGGLAGAVLVPLFAVFSIWFLGLEFKQGGLQEGLFYLATGGYAYGSLWLASLDDDESEKPAARPALPQAPVKPPLKAPVKAPPQKQLSAPNVVPFKFADWDDEGKRK